LGGIRRCLGMAVDGDNWVEALQAFRKRLNPFVRQWRELDRLLGHNLRSSDDSDAALTFLRRLGELGRQGVPFVEGYEAWVRYWEDREKERLLRFEETLREKLRKAQDLIREKTGENWTLGLEGSYPHYTIGGVITEDVTRLKGGLEQLIRRIEKRLEEVLLRRFRSVEDFLRCLHGAYEMATALDRMQGRQHPVDQELRRVHRLMPVAMSELRLARGSRYPVEAFEVDLGRLQASGRTEIDGKEVELIKTKMAANGVRAIYPELPTIVYGRIRFNPRG